MIWGKGRTPGCDNGLAQRVNASVITAISMRQAVIPPQLQSRLNVLARRIAYRVWFTSGAASPGALSARLEVGLALRLVFVALIPASFVAGSGTARRP